MTKIEEAFYKLKASPIFWREKAESLKYAAGILWPTIEKQHHDIQNSIENNTKIDFKAIGPEIFPIYLAMLGFSIECLFKALIIRDNPEYVTNGKLSKKITNHNLIELAKTAGITLSSNELIFCKQAYENMLIDFRYPIGKEVKPLNYSFSFGGNCSEVFNVLYERIYPTVDQLGTTKKVKKSPASRRCAIS